MDYPISAPGFGEGRLVLQSASMWKGPVVLQDGEPAPKVKLGVYRVRRDDGAETEIKVKASLFDTVPVLEVNGEQIRVVPPLPWYMVVVSALPLILIFMGGAIGGAFGGMAFYLNLSLFRSQLPLPVRFLAAFGVLGAAVIGYLAVAVPLFLMLKG